jgi:DNA-binding beta-propeller fold protein YncE
MGDVFQSMTRIGDSLFLCVNNSDKIVVLNVTTKKIAGTISIPKPRYIVAVNRSLAYVSTLYSNKIYTIDPTTLQVKGAIDMPYNNSEGMSLQGGTLWVCHWDTSCRSINGIDALTGQKTRTISIGKYAPHTILADKEGLLWVMSGNVTKGRSAALSRIDPSTGLVVRQLDFAGLSDPVKPVFNRTKDTLWFIQVKYDGSEADNGIYRMSINDTSLPTAPLIKASKFQYYWALGIDPVNGNVYVGDPKGFVQKGQVSIYNTVADLQKTFSVGVGPGQFYFDK